MQSEMSNGLIFTPKTVPPNIGRHISVKLWTVLLLLTRFDHGKAHIPRRKSWHALQYLSGNYQFVPFPPQFSVVYRDEVVIARLQHCWREGVAYSSDAIKYCPPNLSACFRAI